MIRLFYNVSIHVHVLLFIIACTPVLYIVCVVWSLFVLYRTTVVFAATACIKEDEYGFSYYSLQEFIPVEISDLTMDDDKISFTTTVSGPSIFVVGVPISTVGVSPTPLPVVPLRCVASVYCSSNLDRYLSGTNIEVTISMDLRREQVNLINKYMCN